ncbi:peptidase M16 [Hoyosella rhizosphaerae]|uniref:Peptidase M16 n=1 Tax=Hoyosella rhizosphaerae TaxID=1755582 RepID=A0A916U599_9ACTN|nr:pitrilysin family protein [Hoyosella rhizosphaerae]GGC60352.1 peptidase M16 [Hoyosella rhizosphaerae]
MVHPLNRGYRDQAAPGVEHTPGRLLSHDNAANGVHRTVLPGGLRIVTEHVPGVQSASVGLWVGVGSRDEHPDHAGAAHFLEHLLFKSTPTRTAQSIAEEIDAVGGDFNAFTAREHTCYFAHVLDNDLELAIDLVTDVVLRGQCHASDVEVERSVVLEELAMRDDDPEDLLGDAFLASVFSDHRLGRPVIGSAESVEMMTRRQLHGFHARRYRPEHMVLSVAGNIAHNEVVELAYPYFARNLDHNAVPAPRRSGTLTLKRRPSVTVLDRDNEQTHISLGVRSFGRHDSRRWALSVLNTALGGGMSSRLFQEVREKRGLAYSVYSNVDTFSDIGAFSIYAGCQDEHLGEVVDVVEKVLQDVAENGITDAECRRAQGNLRGQLVLGLEDVPSRMHRIGRSELSYGNHFTVSDTIARINAVTGDEVRAVAHELLQRPMGAAVVGPFADTADLPASVRRLCRIT